MDLFSINKIILIFINAIGILLAFWVYFTNRKKRSNQIFFLMTFSILLWVNFAVLGSSSRQVSSAIFWYRLNFGAVFLFFISAYFFSKYFPRKEKEHQILDKFILSIGIVLCFVSVLTNLIIKDVKFKEWGAEIVFGKGMTYVSLVALTLTCLILFYLFRKYFYLSKEEKLKTQYFLIGALIFAIANVIFNVILPLTMKTAKYQHLGDFSIIFFLGFTAFAIVRRELFGIKVILTQLLVGLMGIVLLLTPFLVDLMETFWLRALLFTVFLLFCLIGHFLIKYTLREVKQKEILEEKVEERTEELQEAKTSLEIKVKARTRELEQLTQSLEKKVQERTKQLQERVNQLERFYKLTVGRELKMVELKKEIQEEEKEVERLKKELEKKKEQHR